MAALLLLAVPCPLFSGDPAPVIEQQIDMAVEQRTGLWGLREDNPLNRDNWQGQPDWATGTLASLDWRIGFSRIAWVDIAGGMDWKNVQGYYQAQAPVYESPRFYLDAALLGLNVREGALRIMAGKTMRNYGSAVLLPAADFLYIDTLEQDRVNHGKWMAGFSLYRRGFSFEAWAAPAVSALHDEYRPLDGGDFDAMILSAAVYSFDIHRLGLVYYHNGAHQLGFFYSGQTGMGFIPYGELAVSNRPLPRNFTPYPPHEGWSFDMVLGGSYSFSRIDGALYAEYRYRSSGFDPERWEALKDKLLAGEEAGNYAATRQALGQTARSLLYLSTPRHTAGIRFQNTRQIADRFDYSAALFYLAPDGFLIRGEGAVTFVERLKIMLGVSVFPSLAGRGEMAWWVKNWQGDITLRWTVKTSE